MFCLITEQMPAASCRKTFDQEKVVVIPWVRRYTKQICKQYVYVSNICRLVRFYRNKYQSALETVKTVLSDEPLVRRSRFKAAGVHFMATAPGCRKLDKRDCLTVT